MGLYQGESHFLHCNRKNDIITGDEEDGDDGTDVHGGLTVCQASHMVHLI